MIHHARGADETILTRIRTSGAIALDPPGLSIEIDDVYGAAPGGPR